MPHDFPDPGSVLCKGLEPVIGGAPVLLILGSFPGRISLFRTRYYANPRNQFWQIIEALFGIGRHLPYERRIESLIQNRVALWDVIGTCRREGSADQRIRDPSFNPVTDFITSYPTIRVVAYNGATASGYASSLRLPDRVTQVTLPSTSPANTRFTLAEKTERWGILLEIMIPAQGQENKREFTVPAGTSGK
jgi:hypoxanthine-DNA glycosylase